MTPSPTVDIYMGRLLLFVFCSSLFAAPSLSASCARSFFKKQKSLVKIYRSLRLRKKTCANKQIYLDFSRRALLAKRLGEALWAADMISNKRHRLYYQAQLLKGRIFLEMGRHEEAIIALRPIALAAHQKKKVAEQAHLALIKAYFVKSRRRKDQNVKYLLGLFYKYYPHSKFKRILKAWSVSAG